MSVLTELFKGLTLVNSRLNYKVAQTLVIPVRYKLKEKQTFVEVPQPGSGCYRRRVHFPEKYTVEPLNTTHLGGRDPVTGRIVSGKIGGGIKHKYHWIKWHRDGPEEGPPKEEKVIRIIKCGCRTANVALVASKDEMKYILATENMKPGDIIRTSKFIPRNPVRPNEGDAYPLGALPMGTMVHNIQNHPSTEFTIIHAAGCFGVIKKLADDKVIVELPNKHQFAFEPQCMATVGRLSNVEHGSTPIGSAQKSRELGNRPASGLWQRKTGRFGRKLRKIPPPKEWVKPKPQTEFIQLTKTFSFENNFAVSY